MLEAPFITLYRLLMTLIIVLARGSFTAQFLKRDLNVKIIIWIFNLFYKIII